ncbi:hypothetical protein [Sphingopyxis panaciterrae]
MTKNLSPEALYYQLGQLLNNMPDLRAVDGNNFTTVEAMDWLARASALAREAEPIGSNSTAIEVGGDWILKGLNKNDQIQKIALAIRRIMARLELTLPTSAKGAFLIAGEEFDALAAVGKLLGEAKTDVLLIDPYMDASTLIEFGGLVADGICLRMLTDEAHFKDTLEPAAGKYVAQYGVARPLEIRLASARSLHDRLIILDSSSAWIVTQSLKDIAKRAHASIQRADEEGASLKVAAFKDIWNRSVVMIKTP